MIYTEYQQVLLTQLQNNDKRIEEIKKEQEEIQNMFLQESKFKPGDLVQVDYKISNANLKFVAGFPGLHSGRIVRIIT